MYWKKNKKELIRKIIRSVIGLLDEPHEVPGEKHDRHGRDKCERDRQEGYRHGRYEESGN